MAQFDSYSVLAPFYESLMYCDYAEWSQYVYEKVLKYAPNKIGADVGCGTGYFTRKLKKYGFDVCGYDLSPVMLNEAKERSVNEGLKIDYYLGDMAKFKSFNKLGFITVINDGLNYIRQDKLHSVFTAFYKNLVKGGMLMFDISSEYKLKNILGNNLFAEDGEELTYLWFNTLFDDRVEMDLTFFSKTGEKYVRKDEKHVQFIHTYDDVSDALKKVGFEVAEVEGHLGKEIDDKTERLNFIAIKR